MSDGYDDSPRRRRSMRMRDRDPEYVQERESTYIQRGSGRPSTDLVYRGRDDSIEDIPRDFPPQAESRRSRYRDDYSVRRSRSYGRRDSYDDDFYSEAGTARSRRDRRERRYHDDDYQSDDYYEPRHERRKSKVEHFFDDIGLGGAVAAVTGAGRARSRSQGARSRRGSPDSDGRSTRTHGDGRKKLQQAATAALLTGVAEAWRSRNEPGGLTGSKGRRIATAALTAAGIDTFLDKNPDEKSKRHILESMAGGLAINRLANGPRDRSGSRGRSTDRDGDGESEGGRARSRSRFSERLRSLSRGRFGRSRSRGPSEAGEQVEQGDANGSQSRRGSAMKNLAALGGIAAAGKAIYGLVRSTSRPRERARDRSLSRSRSPSEDSFVPTRQQRYGRNRGGPTDAYDDNRVARPRGRGEEGGERKRDSSNTSTSTADLENQRKRTRGKELLTAGLATVATIHAVHGVYSSMIASEKRRKMVKEGEMTPEEARKRKSKNRLQDAAAVGIAALGIKSAFSEWKEMNEQRHSVHELEEKRLKRRKAREKRERENRQNGFGASSHAYPYLGPPANYQPTAYADGNPYAAIPPPPMGSPPQNR